MNGKVTVNSIIAYLEEEGLQEQAEEIRRAREAYKLEHPTKPREKKPVPVKEDGPDGYGTPYGSIEIKDLAVLAGIETSSIADQLKDKKDKFNEINPIINPNESAEILTSMQLLTGSASGVNKLLKTARDFVEKGRKL